MKLNIHPTDVCISRICLSCAGVEESVLTAVAKSLEECANLRVFTQLQVGGALSLKKVLVCSIYSSKALEYIGNRLRQRRMAFRKSKSEETRDVLAEVVLAHVPVSQAYVG